ncbi:MAG TPA: PEP-CTERM sorting domain-containing protein [Terriglobales bacterium]
MRRVVVLAILALALPMAAWADGITIINQFGSIAITSGGIGSSTISSHESELVQYNNIAAAKGQSLGYVNYSTGVLLSGSVATGGTFSSTGSSFDVIGVGKWAKALTGSGTSPVALFTGSFTGPITWTMTGQQGAKVFYSLSGDISGTLWNGRMVNGTTTQEIYSSKGQLAAGIGHINMGTTQLAVPEPGTLGLLGTGLVGIAGMFRRKLIGR